jgi:hypothetical protein
MLSPWDAKLAEAYAVECEHQARPTSAERIRPKNSSVRSQRAVDPTSSFDASHPSCVVVVLNEPRPSSTILRLSKGVLRGDSIVLTQTASTRRTSGVGVAGATAFPHTSGICDVFFDRLLESILLGK